MATKKIKCETVTARIQDSADSGILLTIPAFTVARQTLRMRIEEISKEYFRLSHEQNESVSLGDFALFILTKAANDPTVQDA